MSWRARWGWLAVPTTWTQCFSIITNIKDDILPKSCLFFLRQKEFYELARQVGLVSRSHHLETVFFNLYLVKNKYVKDDILPQKIVCFSRDKRNSGIQ
jgi:hypothetical protein